MNQTLTKNAQGIQDILADAGCDCKVLELSESTRSAQDAANAIGCNVEQIVKSLIFKTQNTQKPVLILASGPNRVNESVIEKHVGDKIVKADADFTRDVTGFAIGGIPPVGHKSKIELIFIDEDLMKYESIWAAAGTPHAVFNMKSSDLINMTGGKIISIQEEK